MMRVPEALEVRSPGLLLGGEDHGHQSCKHDVTTPSRTCREVCEDETHEAEILLGRELSEVIPMRNGVDPGEENDRPRGDWNLQSAQFVVSIQHDATYACEM